MLCRRRGLSEGQENAKTQHALPGKQHQPHPDFSGHTFPYQISIFFFVSLTRRLPESSRCFLDRERSAISLCFFKPRVGCGYVMMDSYTHWMTVDDYIFSFICL